MVHKRNVTEHEKFMPHSSGRETLGGTIFHGIAQDTARWWEVLLFRRWSIYLVILVAIGLRVMGVTQWSLWLDEETTIFFAANLDKTFPTTFPVFFVVLRWLYDFTGVSPAAGRLLAGLFGVVHIWLTYDFLKKYLSKEVGVVAALLLALCLGHIFWSQSIRYYTLLLAVQTLAFMLFFDGLEEENYWKLIAAAICLNVSMLVHFSGVLLVPVWGGYLLIVRLTGTLPRSYGWRGWLAVGIPTLLGMVLLVPRFFALQQTGVMGEVTALQTSQSLLHSLARTLIVAYWPQLVRSIAYYGAPMVALAFLVPFVSSVFRRRPLIFLATLGIIPLLELMMIWLLQLGVVLWYHALVAIGGIAGLAAAGVMGLYAVGWRRVTGVLALGTLVYYGIFLGLYYTEMHGDRPRWQAAADYVQQANAGLWDPAESPAIFATAPGVVAYYLGVPPGQTMGHPLVRSIPFHPPTANSPAGEWYLVKQSQLLESDAYRQWFSQCCELKAKFEARTVHIDRTILIYFRPPSS